MNLSKLQRGVLFSGLLVLAGACPAFGQATYTWQGATAGTWTTSANWTSANGGTTYPGALDTANINPTGTQNISYNAGSAGQVGTLNMINSNLNAVTSVTLAAGSNLELVSGGTLQNANSGSTTGGQTIALNGQTLSIGDSSHTSAALNFGASGSNNYAPNTILSFTGAGNINDYGSLNFYGNATGSNIVYYGIDVSTSGGISSTAQTLTLEGTGAALNLVNQSSTIAGNRLYNYENFVANTGSTIESTGSAQAATGILQFYGLNNTIQTGVNYVNISSPLSSTNTNGAGISFFDTTAYVNTTATTQTISVGSPIPMQIRPNVTGGASASTQKVAKQVYISTAAGNAVDQLVLLNAANYNTQDFVLGSNLVLASGQLYALAVGTNGTATTTTNQNTIIDLAGFTYDASAATTGFMEGMYGNSPNVFGGTSYLPIYLINSSTSSLANGNGVIKAPVISLSFGDVGVGRVPTVTGSTATLSSNAVSLVATGTSGTNDLGVKTGGTSTINPNTIFNYIGNGTENLQSTTGGTGTGRAVGEVIVGNGTSTSTLKLTTSDLTSANGLIVNAGSTLDLNGKNYKQSEAAGATIGGLNGGGTVLNNGNGATTLTLDTTYGNGSYSGTIADHTTGTGTVALVANGTGTQTFTGNSTYSGGTTISTGSTIYASNAGGTTGMSSNLATTPNALVAANSGSALGSGAVSVSGTLGGSGTINGAVTVQSGGRLFSGAVQSNAQSATNPTGTTSVTGGNGANGYGGLTLTSTLTTVNGGALTFDLGSTTSTAPAGGSANFANPNQNSTYLSMAGGSTVSFATSGTTAINLVDLTAQGTTATLTLRFSNPYLLIAANSNSDFNLMTTGGYDQNGFVLGTSANGGATVDTSAFALEVLNLSGTRIDGSTNYENLQLYLYNGELEVVPEPGTWALMLGGLGVLVFCQRQRRDGRR